MWTKREREERKGGKREGEKEGKERYRGNVKTQETCQIWMCPVLQHIEQGNVDKEWKDYLCMDGQQKAF